MGWVISLGAIIWGAVSAAAAAVASAAAIAALAVYNAIAALAAVVWSTAAGIVVGISEGLGIISSITSANILSTVGAMNAVSVAVYSTAAGLVGGIVTGFKTFLEVIHFATLIKIHEIAYIVSEDYREMMQKVYGQLSQFSSAIGLGAQFITLAIRNARSVVLDVSSMLGRGYDLGEVTWLVEMNKFFEGINEESEKIAQDPYYILDMIDRQLMKPTLDTKGSIVSGLYSTIDNTLDAVNNFVTDIDTVRDDLQQFYNDLPENIQQQLKPFMENVIEPINDFIENTYAPQYDKITRAMTSIEERVGVHKEAVENIVKRLTKPGDLLQSIVGLPQEEADAQTIKMYEAVNAPILQAVPGITIARNDAETGLESIVKALESNLKPPEVITLEPVTIGKKGEGSEDSSTTWMVGDY